MPAVIVIAAQKTESSYKHFCIVYLVDLRFYWILDLCTMNIHYKSACLTFTGIVLVFDTKFIKNSENLAHGYSNE